MQGKEASEQETVKYSAGIDVGKSWLDAHIVPADRSLRVANTREGIAKLKRWPMRVGPDLVAVEATGKWHRLVCRSPNVVRVCPAAGLAANFLLAP